MYCIKNLVLSYLNTLILSFRKDISIDANTILLSSFFYFFYFLSLYLLMGMKFKRRLFNAFDSTYWNAKFKSKPKW